ncbi:MAG: hypothetical protein E3K32_07230 [wastewater metagenome]|nr:hypothetical protein [Candidatus Loosdrechtia aerotolerans]
MVHYTCDMCGKSLVADEDIRYVVKIEVYTACDTMDGDLEEVMEDDDESYENFTDSSESIKDDDYRTFRFDLCTKCHKKYLQDPLFLKPWHRIRFSEN